MHCFYQCAFYPLYFLTLQHGISISFQWYNCINALFPSMQCLSLYFPTLKQEISIATFRYPTIILAPSTVSIIVLSTIRIGIISLKNGKIYNHNGNINVSNRYHWTKKRFCQNALFVKMFFKESAPPIGRRTKKLSRRWPFLLSSINRTKNAAEVHKAAELPLPHLCEGKWLKTKNQWGEGELVIFGGERFLSLQKLCFAQVVVRCKDASWLRHK